MLNNSITITVSTIWFYVFCIGVFGLVIGAIAYDVKKVRTIKNRDKISRISRRAEAIQKESKQLWINYRMSSLKDVPGERSACTGPIILQMLATLQGEEFKVLNDEALKLPIWDKGDI